MNSVLRWSVVAWSLVVILGCGDREDAASAGAPEGSEAKRDSLLETGGAATSPLYAFEMQDVMGQPVSLLDFRGKVLLVVNVASRCGYTRQYAGLQDLYERYAERGLVVLGFPANNFGAQEPGTNEQIRQFCTSTFGVSFPMFAKISVKGDDIHPLYRYLTDERSNPGFGGPIPWNFTKFLLARNGEVVGRYKPAVEPLGEQFLADVGAALAAPAGSSHHAVRHSDGPGGEMKKHR